MGIVEYLFAQTVGEQWLKSEVGNARVGMANCARADRRSGDIGVLPDDNDYYGISELAVYDQCCHSSTTTHGRA